MAFILLVLAGSAAFAALDMPSRLIFQDSGMYWNYPGRERKIFCVYGKNSSLIRNRYV